MPTKIIGFSLFLLGLIYFFSFVIPNGTHSPIKHLFNVAALFISGLGLIFYKKK